MDRFAVALDRATSEAGQAAKRKLTAALAPLSLLAPKSAQLAPDLGSAAASSIQAFDEAESVSIVNPSGTSKRPLVIKLRSGRQRTFVVARRSKSQSPLSS